MLVAKLCFKMNKPWSNTFDFRFILFSVGKTALASHQQGLCVCILVTMITVFVMSADRRCLHCLDDVLVTRGVKQAQQGPSLTSKTVKERGCASLSSLTMRLCRLSPFTPMLDRVCILESTQYRRWLTMSVQRGQETHKDMLKGFD